MKCCSDRSGATPPPALRGGGRPAPDHLLLSDTSDATSAGRAAPRACARGPRGARAGRGAPVAATTHDVRQDGRVPTPPFARAARATRSVEEHRAAVAELLAPLPVERVPLGRARGRVLAEALVAGIALPPFDNSAMDGYAVRAADVAGATEGDPRELPVAADIPAGRTDVPPLEPGTAHRIMTGAPLPAGADTVVQVEHTDGGTRTGCASPRARGGHVGPPGGGGRRRGEVVLPAGTVLGAPQIGVAAAIGRDPARASPADRARAVHRLRTGRAGHAAAARPDLRVERADARRRGGGRRGCRGAAALRARTTSRSARRARRAGGRDRRPRAHLGRDERGRLRGRQGRARGPGRQFVKVAMQPGGPAGRGAGTAAWRSSRCPATR